MDGNIQACSARVLDIASSPELVVCSKPAETAVELQEAVAAHHESSKIFDMTDTLAGKAAKAIGEIASLVTLPLMTLIISLEVIFRYILGAGFRWTQEACGILLLVFVVTNVAYAWQKDRHIRMDLIYTHAGKAYRRFVDVLILICGSIYFGFLMWAAAKEIPYQFTISEATEEILFPMWILNAVIAVSGLCLLLTMSRYAFRMISKK